MGNACSTPGNGPKRWGGYHSVGGLLAKLHSKWAKSTGFRENMSDNSDKFFDPATKAVALLIVILYVMGFAVISSYLGRFGFVNFEVVNAKYLAAGVVPAIGVFISAKISLDFRHKIKRKELFGVLLQCGNYKERYKFYVRHIANFIGICAAFQIIITGFGYKFDGSAEGFDVYSGSGRFSFWFLGGNLFSDKSENFLFTYILYILFYSIFIVFLCYLIWALLKFFGCVGAVRTTVDVGNAGGPQSSTANFWDKFSPVHRNEIAEELSKAKNK